MAADHIETRTPEEMLQQAYDNCIKCGEYYLKLYGWKHEYIPDKIYRFSFDKNATYFYSGSVYSNEAGLYIYLFGRVSDGSVLRMTKYSEPPEEV